MVTRDVSTDRSTKVLLGWSVQEWLNTTRPPDPIELRGRVVMIEAFQMLCPGCVSQGLPQAQRVHNMFSDDDVVVIGLHSVFEHHQAQGQTEVLRAFLHEYRITFPIAIDMPSETESVPKTMSRFNLRGTPSLLLFDRLGHLRANHFGTVDDLALGVSIATLLHENHTPTATGPRTQGQADARTDSRTDGNAEGCDETGCEIS
jgi:thiol-disulfide isomerase/thioredoxin